LLHTSQAKIQEQPISAEEAHKLKEQEYQLQYAIAHNEQETKRSYQCVAEFQMCYNRSIQQIDKARQQINDKLRKVTSLMASWSSTVTHPNLSLIEYDSNKRSSYDVIKNLMEQAKSIKVWLWFIHPIPPVCFRERLASCTREYLKESTLWIMRLSLGRKLRAWYVLYTSYLLALAMEELYD